MKTLKKTSLIAKGLVLGAFLLWVPMSAVAGPHGFDLHNTLSPKAAGMAGTNIAGNNGGPVEAVFGNPANLADFYNARTGGKTGTNFTFGATLYYPDANADHRGAITGTIRPGAFPDTMARGSFPFGDLSDPNARGTGPLDGQYDVDSSTDIFPVPQIALTQDLTGVGLPVVLGAGLSVISGIGVDWRRDPNTLGAGAELVIFGVNLGAGYEVSPAFDVGFAATVSYATLDAVVGGSSGLVHDIGFRGTIGGDYHLSDSTDIAFYYQTELRQNYNDFLLLSNGCDATANPACGATLAGTGVDALGTAISNAQAEYSNLDVEQPSNIALGISHKFTDNMRVALDVIYKQWSEASFWKRLYHDQTAVSVGGEYDHGSWTFRAGYGYANDPKRERVEALSLEGYNYVCTGTPGFGGHCLPLTALTGAGVGGAAFTGPVGEAFWSWFQAMNTPVIYKHRLTAGFTYHGFLAPFLDLDVHVAHQFREEEDYSTNAIPAHTELDVQSWHTGFALTWAF